MEGRTLSWLKVKQARYREGERGLGAAEIVGPRTRGASVEFGPLAALPRPS